MNFGRSNPLSNLPEVVKNLLIVNVLCFLCQLSLPHLGIDFNDLFSLHFWRSDNFYPHQLITHMFLHGSLMHLIFNMFFGLVMFGGIIEQTWGSKKFLKFYVITGIGAGLIQSLALESQFQLAISDLSIKDIQYLKSNITEILDSGMAISSLANNQDFIRAIFIYKTVSVGASGAIFGLLVAFGSMFPDARLMLLFPPIPIRGKYIAILALILGIILDFQGNVAHFAHLGGMLFGFILIKMWKSDNNQQNFY